jgi:hypothetical protein
LCCAFAEIVGRKKGDFILWWMGRIGGAGVPPAVCVLRFNYKNRRRDAGATKAALSGQLEWVRSKQQTVNYAQRRKNI